MEPLNALIPWEPSFVVPIAALVAIIIYVRGYNRIAVPLWQKIMFSAGALSLYIVSYTQFDYYAEHEFFMHRLQHSVLHHIGPMLIILSMPAETLLAGIPVRWRAYIRYASNTWPIRFLMHPAVVTATFVGLIAFWLIPPVHFIGMLDWRFYRLMNWGMLMNGLMFWGIALGPSHRRHPLSAGERIAMMLTIIPPQIIIGAVIFYASYDLYPLYTLCGRAFGGMTAMADQQTGGLILWLMGSMMSVIGILIVACRSFSISAIEPEFAPHHAP